jgi:acyl-CoA reductase-like NAD-dependent aldehyde dehydrogenase
VWKIAPALAFGNTVVWKPSQLVPHSSVNIVELLHEAGVPPGVVNLITGGRDPGEALVADPRIDGISFTGSTAVGRAIQREIGGRGVKVQLELGGKNPVIVMEDADIELAVRETVRGAMLSTGQRCTATSRAIVVGDPERFTEALLPAVAALRVGDPSAPGTDVGPLASAAQYETVLSYFGVARDEGHELAAGGEPIDLDGGYFVAPTVYTGVTPESRIAREEVFGPLLGVIQAGSIEEAVGIANAVDYGLSAFARAGQGGARLLHRGQDRLRRHAQGRGLASTGCTPPADRQQRRVDRAVRGDRRRRARACRHPAPVRQ